MQQLLRSYLDSLLEGVVFTPTHQKVYNELKDFSKEAVIATKENSTGLDLTRQSLDVIQKMDKASNEGATTQDKVDAAIASAGFVHGLAEGILGSFPRSAWECIRNGQSTRN
ncbi:MAG: hypothetical protein ACR2PX_06845 [Endozoicomonas sp.]|uniref:hypothetical protein n=1 Tax=Endozoicomonas sp. TaxID=1892382 RepID=UPI003D9AC27F